MTALSVEGVALDFGGVKALDGVSVHVPRGQLVGLIGPNGAGKTTLFNVVSGVLKPMSGRVRLGREDVTGLSPHRLTAKGLVRTFQIARGFPKLTLFEHLLVYGPRQPGESLGAALFGSAAARAREAELRERAFAIAERLRLTRVLDNRVGEVSGGQKKLLEIGRALMAEPDVILLDEPAAGVNPTLAEEIGDHLRAIVAEGRTILLIEHDMALIERICDSVVVMALGRTLAEGSFDKVRENRDVQDAYLGGRR